jgi:16S rRNA (adenine1518-N6/adenine1519-N6)-dimethyltransferase
MVQKEVGERIVAPAGDTNRGVLSVMVQYFGRPEIVGHVSKSTFWPPPQVDSVIVRITVGRRKTAAINHSAFFSVVRAGFARKRAQIRNSLKHSLHLSGADVTLILSQAGVDPSKRAEELTVDEWGALARVVSETFSHGTATRQTSG